MSLLVPDGTWCHCTPLTSAMGVMLGMKMGLVVSDEERLCAAFSVAVQSDMGEKMLPLLLLLLLSGGNLS